MQLKQEGIRWMAKRMGAVLDIKQTEKGIQWKNALSQNHGNN